MFVCTRTDVITKPSVRNRMQRSHRKDAIAARTIRHAAARTPQKLARMNDVSAMNDTNDINALKDMKYMNERYIYIYIYI